GSAIFGMEVVARRFSLIDAVPLLLSAVIGAATASAFLGQSPVFTPPEIAFSTQELWLCFLLGLALGVLSLLWVRLFIGAEGLFERLPLPAGLKPGLGGLVAGVSALYLLDYGVMGVGYDGVERILSVASGPAGSDVFRLVLFLL
ncbi:MAG TPA: chloride channel protein, partial [Methanothrix sp.]|nr:chloride channel protein [Methanothrix sp.]